MPEPYCFAIWFPVATKLSGQGWGKESGRLQPAAGSKGGVDGLLIFRSGMKVAAGEIAHLLGKIFGA